jgi:hypothetical protein
MRPSRGASHSDPVRFFSTEDQVFGWNILVERREGSGKHLWLTDFGIARILFDKMMPMFYLQAQPATESSELWVFEKTKQLWTLLTQDFNLSYRDLQNRAKDADQSDQDISFIGIG